MSTGLLLLGATPLGQPDDASKRLLDALRTADVVAAEDTRRIRTLARSVGVDITGRVLSMFDGNEAERVPGLVAEITAGATVLVVSDAGMPLLNDPGYRLVTACVAAGLTVSCLPGPSAVTTALAVSGLPTDRFCFEGFGPRKASARRAWLAGFAAETRTVIFFESPRRLAGCLADAVEELGADRRAVVCRELTKVNEEIRRGTLTAKRIDRPALTRTLYAVLPAGRHPHAPEAEMMRFVATLEERVLQALGPFGRTLK